MFIDSNDKYVSPTAEKPISYLNGEPYHIYGRANVLFYALKMQIYDGRKKKI